MVVGPLVVHVARLRRSPGTALRVHKSVPLEDERLAPATPADSRVPEGDEADCDFLLESYSGGIMATGTVRVRWVGLCRRCTAPVEGTLEVSLKERYCDPPGRGEPEDEEAYPIVDDTIDLGPMVHEAILTELPLAPLCREDCRGLCPSCGIDRNEETCACVAPRDPRWASLDVLRSTP
ncbi:MAG TPA: DUF177 domain-containing protein [Acidimicrobiales bacterium]|nr:DUF177 domain-containing protein [Acidimicrobiales bacterium]